LVYSVVPDHPLGLEVGDIVLGYDGVAWKDIYPRLIEAELPVTGFWWGSSPSSYEHSWLMAAGLNWHLFDTIDVVKHRTGETVHLSTKPLVGAEMQLFCSEQLPVPGVPFPKDVEANLVGYGVVEGTRIGYIYVWGWYGNVRQDFRAAVEALAADTTGLIIDFRMDYGGNMFLSNDGLSLLFPAPTPTIGWVVRKNKRNHLAMEADPDGPPSNYVIPSNGVGYDHPIAVLVGPGALSSGDQVALRMRFHPRARLFGESTSTAFNAPTRLSLHPEWGAAYAAADSYLLSAPDNLLTHDELEVDEPVWLTQDDVIAGRDSVVSAAIDWINRSNAP
jgi:C-terminal processing protease CtpA/Prc